MSDWVGYDIDGANRISRVRKGQLGSCYYMHLLKSHGFADLGRRNSQAIG